jgi:hypothetical protein
MLGDRRRSIATHQVDALAEPIVAIDDGVHVDAAAYHTAQPRRADL